MTELGEGFLFSIPYVEGDATDGAQIAIKLGALASRLCDIDRTRCIHPGGRPENDAEHSLMLAKIAPEIATLLYPELDENLVARFATLHDDVEAYVGDTPTDIIANCDDSAKEKLESLAFKQLIDEYSDMPGYCQRIREYEEQSVPEARFTRAVDKLMVLLIHFPCKGAVLRQSYSRESYLESERVLIERYRHKFGEFELIIDLRKELGIMLADQFLG